MNVSSMRSGALQFIRFGVTGILNTMVGLGVIWVCWHIVGLPTVPANLIGYCVGLCVSFTINRTWTFRSERSARSAIPRFLLVFAVAYLANLATLLPMIHILHVSVEWATLAANVVYTIVFFIGSRWFAFSPQGPARRAATWLAVRKERR